MSLITNTARGWMRRLALSLIPFVCATLVVGLFPRESTATPSLTTTVNLSIQDASTSAAWSGTETTGASVAAQATVAAVSGVVPTGTVTYDFSYGGTCSAAGGTWVVTLDASGVAPASPAQALSAGTYSYTAVYSGDAHYAAAGSSCVSFTVGKASLTITPTVVDASTYLPWTNMETAGASALALLSISDVAGTYQPQGDAVYTLYNGSTCSGTSLLTDTVAFVNGPPYSRGPIFLTEGSYSYAESYSGDSNYNASPILCAPFSVAQVPTALDVQIDDATTNLQLSGPEAPGASVYATANVGNAASDLDPMGLITYNFFSNGSCSGTPVTAESEPFIRRGAVRQSDVSAPLEIGSYSYMITYPGDMNYTAASTMCLPIPVVTASVSMTISVLDAGTNAGWTGTEVMRSSAYAIASISGDAAIAPTGTVTFRLFSNATCGGAPMTADQVMLSGGAMPQSGATPPLVTGLHSFDALYSGDANYPPAQATCVAFTVASNPVTLTPAMSTIAPLKTITFTEAGGSGTGWSFALSVNASGGSVDSTSGVYTAGPNGGHEDLVTVTDSLGNSATATVQVLPPPEILAQPEDVEVFAGQPFTLTVVASGQSPTYQWLQGAEVLPGATTASYSVQSAQASDAGRYMVIVKDVIGIATSNTATVTVDGPPVITTQPPAAATVSLGSTFTLSVTATGLQLEYTWRHEGSPIAGAASASYTVAAARLSDAGSYDVVVTNLADSVTSSTVMVAVTCPSGEMAINGTCAPPSDMSNGGGTHPKQGCGCAASDSAPWLAAAALAGWIRSRRRVVALR